MTEWAEVAPDNGLEARKWALDRALELTRCNNGASGKQVVADAQDFLAFLVPDEPEKWEDPTPVGATGATVNVFLDPDKDESLAEQIRKLMGRGQTEGGFPDLNNPFEQYWEELPDAMKNTGSDYHHYTDWCNVNHVLPLTLGSYRSKLQHRRDKWLNEPF